MRLVLLVCGKARVAQRAKGPGNWAVTLVPGGNAVLQGQPVSLSPLSFAGSSNRGSHNLLGCSTHLPPPDNYLLINSHISCYILMYGVDVSLNGF